MKISRSRKKRARRRRIGAPPFSKREQQTLVNRVMGLGRQRAKVISMLPLGPFWSFVGYSRADLIAHLERRHRQGCILCGADHPGDRPVIVHIDPLALAFNGVSLQKLMQLSNIGLGHARCNRKLGTNPLT